VSFEGESASFAQLGINVRVLQPGRTGGLYHAESVQEDFLVLAGHCLVLIEEHERRLGAWDLVHCPPGTAHALLPVGDRPCILLLVGARREGQTFTYPRWQPALRHGVGVERETTSPGDAQAQLGISAWRHARPDGWADLPWAG
jgi:uncharacterized cupin superfamily protein